MKLSRNFTGLTRGKAAAWGAGLLCGAAAAALLTSPLNVFSANAKPLVVETPKGAPMSFADLIESVSPAVVSVQVVTEIEDEEAFKDIFERFRGLPGFEDFMERHGQDADPGDEEEKQRRREGRSLGSGFFISPQGYIVTNNHVVEKATEVTVSLSDGEELECEIIGTDPATDLAVLKVKKPGAYPYVNFSDKKTPRVGDWVVAVGNPFGLGGTATAGIVSAAGRELGGNYNDFIQIDASINRGNSGGPTFDLDGNVIGVNTAIFSPSGGSVGIGFAIEAKAAKQIVDILIRDGKVTRGWLGVSIQNLSEEAAEAIDMKDAKGALVADVQQGSPAETAGIKPWDVILSVNGNQVDNSRQLTQLVGSLLAGSNNEFEVFRDGKIKNINVTVGVRPDDPDAAFNRSGPDEPKPGATPSKPQGEALFGLTLTPLTAQMREALGLDKDEKGLLVSDMKATSAWADAGIEEGDALLEAQGTTLGGLTDLQNVVSKAKSQGKANILVAVRKGRSTLFLPVKIADF